MSVPPPPDAIRSALDSVFARPVYGWTADEPSEPFLLRWWAALARWVDALEKAHPALFKLLIVGLIAVLLLILAHGAWTAWRTMRPAVAAAADGVETVAESVPDEALDRTIVALAAEGRFAEAMRAAFRRLVLRLEAEGAIASHTGLTPREVARAARLAEADRYRLQGLVEQLYAVAFARRPCSAAEFTAWLSRLDAARRPRAA